jgi:hypothetical protein
MNVETMNKALGWSVAIYGIYQVLYTSRECKSTESKRPQNVRISEEYNLLSTEHERNLHSTTQGQR